VHEAINKFVVYEKFAEMTHKYDVQNFSKLLDDYNTADELKSIRAYLDIEQQQVSEEGRTGLAEEAKGPSPKQATSYRFHFVQYQTTGSRGDLTQIPREELTLPKEKLSAYTAAHYPELLRYILLARIIHQTSDSAQLHEEYYVALNRILGSGPEARRLFVEVLMSACHTDQMTKHTWLSRGSFLNLKHAVDLFLYEAQEDLEAVLMIMPALEVFFLKSQDKLQTTLRMRVRDHIVWKSEPIWRLKFKHAVGGHAEGEEVKEEEGSVFYRALLSVVSEMADYRVPIEVVDAFVAEQLATTQETSEQAGPEREKIILELAAYRQRLEAERVEMRPGSASRQD